MIMESQKTYHISFIRIAKINELGEEGVDNVGIELITCGMDGGTRNVIKSPVRDVRSIMSKEVIIN